MITCFMGVLAYDFEIPPAANDNFVRDQRLAQVDAAGVVTYIHTDKQNSVVALTNSSGAAISRRGYGTYGETNPAQMAETTHPFGYTGRRWESDLGLYYYRARWYDPELGTFLETDPIGAADYVNLYSYVGLEPMDKTDPSGMLPPEGSKEEKRFFQSGREIANGVLKSPTKVDDAMLVAVPVGLAAVSAIAFTWPAATITAPEALAAPEASAAPALAAPPASTLQPGKFAGESIPATSSGATAAERTTVTEIGKTSGCHICGSTTPGTRSGNLVRDQQPPPVRR